MENMIKNVKDRLEDMKSLMRDNSEFQNKRREWSSSKIGRDNGWDVPELLKYQTYRSEKLYESQAREITGSNLERKKAKEVRIRWLKHL